ncbi:MAG: succinate dehydrogenase flavoprotein subunit [Myxococcota bacterium]
MLKEKKAIVVGGGLAGLMTTIKLCELGFTVRLFALSAVKRSHSVCAQGGINAAINIKGEGDSPEIHFDDSVFGGDFLANQPPVKGMCYSAPAIVYLMDRMGVPFSRTPEGNLDFRRFGGTLYNRTAFAGATTGQQLIYALDEQTRKWESEGQVEKYEYWEFLDIVKDNEGVCRGITAMSLVNHNIEFFRADVVMVAPGGPGLIYGRTTNSMANNGCAAGQLFRNGVYYANGEFVQVHPTAIPGEDKLRLMSESARGEGGRVWVPRKKGDTRDPKEIPENERYYFLEEKYPKYGNLVPRDIATRELFDICRNQGLGVGGGDMVYLDLTHKDPEWLTRRLGGILEIYEKFVGDDPRTTPMKIFPAYHYSMGGIWVDFEKDSATGMLDKKSPRNQMTNIKGLYASGEGDYQYHGANRLGANSLLSCLYAGMVGAEAMNVYVENMKGSSDDVSISIFESERARWEEYFSNLANMHGKENPYRLHQELGEEMTKKVSIVRKNSEIIEMLDKIKELKERWNDVNVLDADSQGTQAINFVRHLSLMLDLAEVITKGALLRDESRGAHYKPDFPKRDDVKFLKTTMAKYTEKGPEIWYEEVDTSLIKPRERKY